MPLSFYLDATTQPQAWNCAHVPVIYEAEPYYQTANITNDGNGYCLVSWLITQNIPIAVGEFIYIDASQYKGFHQIRSVNLPYQVVLETAYAGIPTALINYAYTPKLTFDIYKGYKTGEGNLGLRTNLPYTLVGSFFVEINTVTISYRWDVSAFLKSIFTIPEPSTGISYDLFNRFRLVFGATNDELEHYQVGNCAIDATTLNDTYVNGLPLIDGDGITFDCGITLVSSIEGGVIRTIEIEGGVSNIGKDFNQLDFFAGATKDFKYNPNQVI